MNLTILAILATGAMIAACSVDMHPSNQRIYVPDKKDEQIWYPNPSNQNIQSPLQNSNY